MPLLLHISLLLALLGLLTYEDLKHRLIHLWIFPLLILVFIPFQWNEFQWWHVLFNGAFLLLQLILLTLWFSLKERKLVFITQRYLGSGDIALWICLTVLFSPANFISFFLISLFISAILALVFQQKISTKIPLAGFQSLVLIAVLIFLLAGVPIKFRDDTTLLNWLL